MKRVMMVAFLFPPNGGGGVQRTTKFVKYLPRYGWEASVIAGPKLSPVTDLSLLNDIPKSTKVVRTSGLLLPRFLPWRVRRFLSSWVLTVDARLGWWPFALYQALVALRKLEHQALYSTSAPYTDHLVAWELHRKTKLPWIADFRDLWVDNPWIEFATRWHYGLCEKLESGIVHNASKVIANTEQQRSLLLARHPDLGEDRIVVITNGYDPEDYLKNDKIPESSTQFNLTYTGSLYGMRQSVNNFLLALHELISSGALSKERFRFRIVGSSGLETKRLIKELRLEEVVEIVGYVPHSDAIIYQSNADALLLLLGKTSGSDVELPAKLFEYLASEKYILALVPQGVAGNLVEEARAGTIIPPDDEHKISAAILDMFEAWQDQRLSVRVDPDIISRFDRGVLTGKLSDLLDQICQ